MCKRNVQTGCTGYIHIAAMRMMENSEEQFIKLLEIENHLSVRLIGEKGFNLLGSIKIGLRRSCGLMSPDLPCSRVMG